MGKKKKRPGVRTPKPVQTLPTPDPKEVGSVIGKALATLLAKKAKETQTPAGASPGLARQSEISNPLLRPEVREASTPPKTLNVRTPDAQRIAWTFERRKPQDAGPYDDPLITRISVPETALWTWKVNKQMNVTAQYDFEHGTYSVSLNFDARLKWIRGSARQAKQVAEALLSAGDWETSWQAVMGKPGQSTREAYADYGTE